MNRTTRVLVALAFLAGCVTTAALNVPQAHASDGKRWEHWCLDVDGLPKTGELQQAGEQGWEMVSATYRPPIVKEGNSIGGGAMYICFKRPN